MLRVIISVVGIISLSFLVVMLNATTPVSAGPFGVIAIFIFMYFLCLGLFSNIIFLFSKLVSHLSSVFMARSLVAELSFKRSYYLSTILAAVPVMLVGLQSVGLVGVYECLLVSVFAIVGCIYVFKVVR